MQEQLSRPLLKVYIDALIRLHFYEDAEMSLQDILDQLEGRSAMSKSQLEQSAHNYINLIENLLQNNPREIKEYLESKGMSETEAGVISGA